MAVHAQERTYIAGRRSRTGRLGSQASAWAAKVRRKSARRLVRRILGACAAAWTACGAASASAAPISEQPAPQMASAALPLLAALGFGIAVAVAAVVAFLHMTVQRKESLDIPMEGDDPSEGEAAAAQSAMAPLPPADPAESDGGERLDEASDPLDYTLPLAAVASRPEPPLLSAAEGEPRICGLTGKFAGFTFRMPDGVLSIGRDPDQCGLVFPMDAAEVSRKHCSLRYEASCGVFWLEDHGSANGTFLNGGIRLKPGKPHALRSGERFSLSGARHLFEVRN